MDNNIDWAYPVLAG